jgi:hypothetical protein
MSTKFESKYRQAPEDIEKYNKFLDYLKETWPEYPHWASQVRSIRDDKRFNYYSPQEHADFLGVYKIKDIKFCDDVHSHTICRVTFIGALNITGWRSSSLTFNKFLYEPFDGHKSQLTLCPRCGARSVFMSSCVNAYKTKDGGWQNCQDHWRL